MDRMLWTQGENWRKGYRAHIMSTLFNFPMAIYTRMDELDADFRNGWDAASDRCENIAAMRDNDPLAFIEHFGASPVNFGKADAIATADAAQSWREVQSILARAEDLHLEDYNETRRLALRGEVL